MERCEKHDLWPCALCNGDDARLKQELAHPDEVATGGPLPPGMAYAEFPGWCASCGFDYGKGSVIRFNDRAQGWVAVGCCA